MELAKPAYLTKEEHAPAKPKLLTHPRYKTGLMSWLTTVDHKRIGILYGSTALVFFLIAGAEALLIRLQLARPEAQVLSAERYNELFTMHGTSMVFLALMPLARILAVSGSALAVPAWILPWSLALTLAAGLVGSRVLLAGAALAAALGTLSHTAMLAWPAGLVVAWGLTARRAVRASWAAVAALLVVGAAWLAQLDNCWEMLARRNERGLLAEALRGFEVRNLFVDPSWVSPVLVALLAFGVSLVTRISVR